MVDVDVDNCWLTSLPQRGFQLPAPQLALRETIHEVCLSPEFPTG